MRNSRADVPPILQRPHPHTAGRPVTAYWRDAAACRDRAPLFDATFDQSHQREPDTVRVARHQMAATVCRTCPVTAECLADARPGRDEGVRAGQVLPPLELNSPAAVCGSRGGARKHRRLDEPVCDPCREGERKAAAADYDHTRRTRGKPR